MTLSWPSFLAAATRPFIPPNAATDVAVAAVVLLPLLAPPPLLDELLPHPAANMTLPAAATAAIAYVPRKVPSRARAGWRGKMHQSWLDRLTSWLDKLTGR